MRERESEKERETVNIFQRNSTIPGAGEGVFLLRNASENRIVALYSGYIYDEPVERQIYKISKVSRN